MEQATRNVLMIRPHRFGPNPETAASNVFQQATMDTPHLLHARALAEFDGLVRALRAAGVCVLVVEDTESPAKPDAVFPNNWVSFHENGDVVLYPLQAPNRRPERRLDVIERIGQSRRFSVRRIVDLSWLEQRGEFLEGTGSLVLDRINGVAYAAMSVRTHSAALAEFTRQTGIEVVAFRSGDENGRPVYHTNVILSIGQHCAVICAEAITDRRERRDVLARLAGTGRRVIEINLSQARRFAANVLEVRTSDGLPQIVMSNTARQALTPVQLHDLGEHAQLLDAPLDTIECVGGGGARCMLAEIFLPERGHVMPERKARSAP